MKRSTTQLSKRREVWRDHLEDVFKSLDIPPGTLSDNIAATVAVYCHHHHPHGLQATDLRLLISRAFCAIGDRSAAGRVLASMTPHSRHIERWLEILSDLHHFPELLPYFSRGIIRPAEWAGAQLDRMWTLDFSRLKLSEAERHEITLYRSVRLLVQQMFVFWDATGGEGILGLKGLESLGVNDRRPEWSLMSATSLVEYIADLFRQQKKERGWAAVPSLLQLDL